MIKAGLRVVYLDIDVHHGDGVEALFYDLDQVLTISLHQHGHTLFPGTGFVEDMGQGKGLGYLYLVSRSNKFQILGFYERGPFVADGLVPFLD